jgi:hypothetical protein
MTGTPNYAEVFCEHDPAGAVDNRGVRAICQQIAELTDALRPPSTEEVLRRLLLRLRQELALLRPPDDRNVNLIIREMCNAEANGIERAIRIVQEMLGEAHD